MRLKSIKLAGFKSFVDPTTVHFPTNLSAVVGPNGCGKSNVIDAIRWVMGESSARHLRGEQLTDVIFNGSSGRKPVGQASIELIFDNSDRSLGGSWAEYAEISIRRVVTREARSDYYLNGTRCRRKDIIDIFLGTGLGPRSYAIIEQGMISRLIESRPEELRVFLEEAAGISRYKDRRRDTELRMRHTRENLDRLGDVRENLGRQLAHLEKQAAQAEQFRQLKEQERRSRDQLLVWRADALAQQHDQLTQQLQALSLLEAEKVAALRRHEADLVRDREQAFSLSDAYTAQQSRYYQLGNDIAQQEQARRYREEQRQQWQVAEADWQQQSEQVRRLIEADQAQLAAIAQEQLARVPQEAQAEVAVTQAHAALRSAEEAQQAWQLQWDATQQALLGPRQAVESTRREIDRLEQALRRLEERAQRQQHEVATLDPEPLRRDLEDTLIAQAAAEERLEQVKAQVDQLQQQVADDREQAAQWATELDALRRQDQALTGRLAALSGWLEAAQAEGQALPQWLTEQGCTVRTLAPDFAVEPAWERAVEAVLGPWLSAQAVAWDDQIHQCLRDASQRPEAGQVNWWLPERAAVAVPEDSLAAVCSGIPPAWQRVLANTLRVDHFDAAWRPDAAITSAIQWVTPEGVVLSAQGLQVPGQSAQAAAGFLAQRRALTALHTEQAELAERLARCVTATEEARQRLHQHEQERSQADAQRQQAERELAACVSQRTTQQLRWEQMAARQERLQEEMQRLAEERQDEREALETQRLLWADALSALSEHQSLLEAQQQAREPIREAVEQARQQVRAATEVAFQLRAAQQAAATREQGLQLGLSRLADQQALLHERREALEIQRLQAAEPEPSDDQFAQLIAAHEAAAEALTALRDDMETVQAQVRARESARQQAEHQVQQLLAQRQQQELALQDISTRWVVLRQEAESLGLDVDRVRAERPVGTDEAQLTAELERLAQRIQRLGAINLAAIEEFEAESTRKTFLDAQDADLREALETLESAIRKIDRETRALFKDTFDRVNQGLQTLFPQVFGGGSAYLELTGDDVLEAGVTIMARPPGKRNATIHLLSGGEKALTALSLVFAIFQLNPAPFCLLDEVDAPLDDANVSRFAQLVSRMSEQVQFIFITHNKIAMEMAHQLMGVTMQEPGVSRLVAVDLDEATALVQTG